MQTKHPLAGDLHVKTLIDDQSAAQTEANRLRDLYKVDRDMFRARVKTQPFSLDLNDVVRLTYPRHGLSSGKAFRIVGLTENASVNEIELDLWG